MSFSNTFLADFRPIYFSILKTKRLRPERTEIEVIDEESDGYSAFEAADVRDVLFQLSRDLNFLTIYTDRPVYFEEFAETMYEENGLVVLIRPKKYRKDHSGKAAESSCGDNATVIFDFEWEGESYESKVRDGSYYIPIHKKLWEITENLDIIVPIGYNTVIVKRICNLTKKPRRDRLEEAFYSECK